MPRQLSQNALAGLYASTTDEVYLVLATIRHEPTASLLRVVNNTTDIVSRGMHFVAYPFTLTLPSESGTEIGTAIFEIDNVEQLLIDTLRAATSAPRVDIEVVLAANPDLVEIASTDMALRQVNWDASSIKGQLQNDDILSQRFPAHTYSPDQFQGLF